MYIHEVLAAVTTTVAPDTSEHAVLWILILSFIVAFFLAFGIGANDVANSFGTSVGSKVLTQRQACILATIFEISGAVALGYKVSSTIRTGMIHVEMYDEDVKLLMIGYMSALFGSAVWNIAATVLGLPVSGTHSIVGAVIGFSLVGRGWNSIKWDGLIKIVVSWFASPVLSGLISLTIYLFVRWHISSKEEPLKNGLRMLPVFYGVTIFINIFSIIHNGPKFMKHLQWWIALIIAIIIGIVCGLLIRIWIVPKLRNKILEIKKNLQNQMSPAKLAAHLKPQDKTGGVQLVSVSRDIQTEDASSSQETNNHGVDAESGETTPKTVAVPAKEVDVDDDKPEVAKIFTFLHILTACFSSFAHGANDTSNAVGPLVAVLMLYQDGTQKDHETPWYLLLFGGVGMSVGLWIWGRKVIRTMGTRLTKITPSTGFCAEIGAATTVLLASKIGIPVSTTHCQVGSVVFVGKAMKSQKGVNWKLFINIALSWGVTVPVSALLSALAMYLLHFAK